MDKTIKKIRPLPAAEAAARMGVSRGRSLPSFCPASRAAHALGFVFALGFVLVLGGSACGGPSTRPVEQKMIVLGIDGLDPKFLEDHFDVLPNMDRLRREGDFKRLTTSIPPQSPVAWSNVITGMDPGGHGIYDFVHRDPATRMPFSSMAETHEVGRTLEIGDWVLPLSAGEVSSGRAGTPFWKLLADAGVPAAVIRMPANFPPVESAARTLSGMGTPDMLGTYGTFTFVTDDPAERSRGVSGGKIVRIPEFGSHTEIMVEGPTNTFRKDRPTSTAALIEDRDPSEAAARLRIGDETIVLLEGEWSDWLRADFPMLGPLKSASGIFRVYLRSVHSPFELYITPINIDPHVPELPISTPADYAAELADAVGLFYTQGMAEDTSALRQGALSLDQFLEQSRYVLEESHALFRYELDRFESGLLFFYFSSIDQNAHMLWGRHDDKLLEIYRRMDEIIGEAMERVDDDTTFIIMSDHGFTRFDRAVHLNTFLMREGFLTLDDPSNVGYDELFAHVDWSRTQAYALGLNGVYLNLLGRERGGIVSEGEESRQVLARLSEKLLEMRDPDTGERVIEEVYLSGEIYKGYNLDFAPELLVGYRPPYRASWETPIGAVPPETVVDNDDLWIGDHCVAARFVPGVFLSNRKSDVDEPRLYDLTVTILKEFGVAPTDEMIGRPLY